jgi:hypothetical protein
MSPISCPQCGSPVEADDRFCTSCGAALRFAVAAGDAVAAPAPAARDAEAAEPHDTEALPGDWLQGAPERSLREIYFELGLKLLVAERAKEALEALDSAQREPGDAPSDTDLALARAGAAEAAGEVELGARLLLEAAILPAAAQRRDIVARLLATLTPGAALAHGRWLGQTWLPLWKRLAGAPADAALGPLLAARAQLQLANYEQAAELLHEAAALDAGTTHAELARMLAPERLPPALADPGADTARVFARLWQAAGDPTTALTVIDAALAEVRGEDYPDAPLLALRADALLALGRGDEAARDLHKAGTRYLWRREGDVAAGLLERAIAQDPGNVEAHWSLADALLIATYQPDLDDSERRARLARARAVWDAGRALRLPGSADAWAYATAAYLAARAAELATGEPREPAYWQAAALIERALLLDADDAARWGNLCEFHRRLMKQQMALLAAQRGHHLRPKDEGPLSELVIVLTNIGRWREASRALQDLEAISKTAWTTFVAARLHLYNGKLDAALERIDEALTLEPGDLTYLATRALILRALGRNADARAQSAKILERWRLDDRENVIYFGSAALDCGDFERALAAYEADLRYAGDDFSREASQRNLALVRLARGELELARAAIDAGCRSAIDAESRWLMNRDLLDLEQQLAERRQDRDVAAVLAEFRRRIEALPQAVAASARAEMEAALAAASEPWQTVGALAGLARLNLADEDFEAAAARYTELQERWSAQFPEADRGIDAAVAGLRNTLAAADYWQRREQVRTPNAWQRQLFDTYLADHFGLAAAKASTAASLLAVTPIAVEMDEALVPEGDSDTWPIFVHHLPEMRKRIERETGVKLPGVRLRSSDELDGGRFVVILGEVPVVVGSVLPDARLCLADPATLEARGVAIVQRETDPLTRAPAGWVAAAAAPELDAAGLPTLDGQAFIVRLLEAVLRRNLADFVGIDEVDQQLARWKDELDRADEIERIRADDELLLRFTRLLRRLARERLAIGDGALLLDAVAEAGFDDPAAALRAARRRLLGPTALPGNATPLPAALESQCHGGLHEVDGKTFLALPPADVQHLFGEIRTLVTDAPGLRVASAALRPHLRDLLEIEFADLPVYAADEQQGSVPFALAPARPTQVAAS